MSLVLPAVPEAVPRARRAVASLCEELGIEREFADDVRLAVTEACTNCVLHSHSDAANPTFVLHARVVDGALVVVVRDFGDRLLRGRARDGLGAGLWLIERLADATDIACPRGGGVRVTMRFAVRTARPALLRPAA